MNIQLNRRTFLALVSAGLVRAQEPITRPVISEDACPVETIAPVARDGYRGRGVLRKPPGPGPFPAIVWIHPGLTTFAQSSLLNIARNSANPSRFLAAGYVVTLPTYRSRDDDPQSGVSLEDCLAVVDHLRRQPYVDPKSIVVYGCSGGGDLALEVAAATDVCAIVPEEPASLLMAGILNTKSPKKGERYTPLDANPIMENPKQFYTPEYQHILRTKIARIKCPILIVQGDEDRRGVSINKFNAEVLIPELSAQGKMVEVLTYPGEPHCFCFEGSGPRTPHPAAALKAYHDAEAFSRRFVMAKPKPLDSGLVRYVPV
jgi:dipeptidyl aminopeptidase/acylaminoacyl peptidase